MNKVKEGYAIYFDHGMIEVHPSLKIAIKALHEYDSVNCVFKVEIKEIGPSYIKEKPKEETDFQQVAINQVADYFMGLVDEFDARQRNELKQFTEKLHQEIEKKLLKAKEINQ